MCVCVCGNGDGPCASGADGRAVLDKGDDMLPLRASQDECPVRHMRDSYQEVIIPLGQDPVERERYISYFETIRFGRILEDLDTFAGWGYTACIIVYWSLL